MLYKLVRVQSTVHVWMCVCDLNKMTYRGESPLWGLMPVVPEGRGGREGEEEMDRRKVWGRQRHWS